MDNIKIWKADRIREELKELQEQYEGLERMEKETEIILKATLDNKAVLQSKIIELKRILFNDFGVVI